MPIFVFFYKCLCGSGKLPTKLCVYYVRFFIAQYVYQNMLNFVYIHANTKVVQIDK